MLSKLKNYLLSKQFLIILSILTIALFFSILSYNPFKKFDIYNQYGTYEHTENPWILQQSDSDTSTQVFLPEHLKLEINKKYTLSTTLTYDGSQDTNPHGFLHVAHMFCKVYLDDEVLFSCLPEDNKIWGTLKSPGFIYKTFSLPRNCSGKELKIELLPMMSTNKTYSLPEITFGDLTTSISYSVKKDILPGIVILICILLGISSILFSSFALQGSHQREGFFVGLFSLTFSVYLLTECHSVAFFIGNPYYLYFLNYLSLSLLPITLLSFMRERIQEKHRKICNWFLIVELFCFLLEITLHISGIYDFRQSILFIHFFYFIDMTLITIFILDIKDIKKRHSLILQIVPVLIGVIIDIIIYWYHLMIGESNVTFTILGVVYFLIVELFHICESSIAIYGESVRSNTYRQMAFIDELTGVGNRRAFDNEIDRILSSTIKYNSMIVISIDINMLKYTNDHFGHSEGDHLIHSAAQFMIKTFSKFGSIYRTGGDEFSIFLYDYEVSDYNELLKLLNERIATFNKTNKFTMSLAIGYEQIFDANIEEAVKEADRKMYIDKARQKMQRKDSVN